MNAYTSLTQEVTRLVIFEIRMKLNHILATILVMLFFCNQAKAQLTCNFSADTLEGCEPLRVNFSELSTGGGTIVYRNWDFGNGGFSNTNNPTPSRVYANSGTYTVSLTVSDGVDTVTKSISNYIRVFKNPTAAFTFNKLTSCPPVNVNFTNQSIQGDAPIQTYQWDYGDLTAPGTTQNPSHSYKFRGTYSVILSVIDTNGCEGTVEQKDTIIVDKPKASFNASKRSDCQAPMTTTFTNSSTGNGNLTYGWFFGDGNTSSATSPTHTYTSAGTFDVLLVVTDIRGCTDSLKINRYISIGQTKADFSVTDTLCVNQTDSFLNLSVGAQTYSWTFTGGGSSTAENPVRSFASTGLKTIQLIAMSGPTCVDTISKTTYVHEIDADYRITYPDPCNLNEVKFFDSSRVSAAVSGQYSYINGTRRLYDSLIDPKIIFPKSFCSPIQRQVRYIAINSLGCRDTISKNIVEYSNSTADISIQGGDRCLDDTLSFSFYGCLVNGGKTFSWNFGTGKPGDTSNLENPTNQIIIDSARIYTISLQIEDSIGCTFSSQSDYGVGKKPTASFTIDDDTLCYREFFQFKSTSTDTNDIKVYIWSFGDGTPGNGKNIDHRYDGLGKYNVTHTVDDNGCRDDTTISIYISGPAASIGTGTNTSCVNPLIQSFIISGAGTYNRFYWDFGDGTGIDSVNVNPTHTYAGSGTYTVTLELYNDTTGCFSKAELKIQPSKISAKVEGKNIFCSDSVVRFDGTKSLGNIGFNFFWDFDNGQTASLNPTPSTTYSSEGVYNARLIVVATDSSCQDTAFYPVYIMPNEPAFSLPSLDFCEGDTLEIFAADSFGVHDLANTNDHSSSFDTSGTVFLGNNRNLFWFWKVNDTLIPADSANYKKVLKIDPPQPNSGYKTDTFSLSLKAVDSTYHFNYRLNPLVPERYLYGDFQGCIQETKVDIIIHDLSTIYRTQDSTLCAGDSIWFQDTSQQSGANVNFKWFFGTGDSSLLSSPTYKYTQRGVFNSMYVTSASICTDTLSIPIIVQGVDSLSFYASLTDTTCFPATTYFFDQSAGDSLTWRYWDFGDGRTPIRSPLKDSLTKTFTDPGKYSVKLIVETSYGCQDSITYHEYINVKGPYAVFSASDDSICLYDEITYTVDTANEFTFSFEWDFSDGQVDTTNATVRQRKHQYNRVGNLSPVLVYRDSGLTCERAFTLDIVIEEVIAQFTISDSLGCAPLAINFTDQSIDGDTWVWAFGDNNSANTENPQNSYQNEGEFIAQLIYENSKNGCMDTTTQSLKVLPRPIVNAFGDFLICLGDSISLNANGASNYVWSPISFMNNRNIASPRVAPTITTKYSVVGTDSNNCTNSDSVIVAVQQIPKIKMPNDTSIIIGEEFNASPEITNGFEYRWEPISGLDCDTCKDGLFDPITSTTYTLFVKDSLGCFEVSKSFFVQVDEKYSVDVAEAFTPNGDGANDLPMLSIAGLGIAFRAKPLVRESAKQAISTLGLDGILYLIGFRDRDALK